MNEISRKFFEDMEVGYIYDSLTLRPRYSDVKSRSDVDLSTEILPGVNLKIPIIASPMVPISESKMCIKMYELGGLGILHRFAPVDPMTGEMQLNYLIEEMDKIAEVVPQEYRAFAVGIRQAERKLLEKMAPRAGIACVDVNIGHHVETLNTIRAIAKDYPHLKIIAGNVSTYEGAMDLFLAGADCVRATNGAGDACTTLKTTGVGLPAATSLYECACAARECQRTVIACGGHKSASSIVVSLALGADAIITGSLLAGSSACPEHAFFLDDNGERKARYFGMASKKAQELRDGMLKPGTAPEGISKTLPLKGKTSIIIEELVGGVRSGLSFCGSHNIAELRNNAEFIRWR